MVELEVRACMDDGYQVHHCGYFDAEFFTLYIGIPGDFVAIGDFDSYGQVTEIATKQSLSWGIPWYNRVEDHVAADWLHHFNVCLHKGYGITISDTGLTEEEIWERYEGTPADVAVDQYAEKYDLLHRL